MYELRHKNSWDGEVQYEDFVKEIMKEGNTEMRAMDTD